MTAQENVINYLNKKNYKDAEEIFRQNPIFDYSSKSPLIKYEYFEFYNLEKKNPIFLRVLLNYISLINLLFDHNLSPIQENLINFCAKITYEKKGSEHIKLILMAKSSTEVYNIYFQKGKDIFKDCKYKIQDIDENEDDLKGIGYTFQELGKIFVNDYVIGTNKGIELPNILFYIKSTEETQKLLNTLNSVPANLKLNLNEILDNSGVTEFDHIIKLNQDLTINENNPYFRYIKQVKTDERNSPVKYGELVLKKNFIYILEFKSSFAMNKDIANLQNLSEKYLMLYNIEQIPNNINNSQFSILYFYNNQENLGYRNFEGYNINLNLWRFLYINPSCQIVPVIKLSSEVKQLRKDFEEEKVKNSQLRKDFEEEKVKNSKLRKDFEEEKLNNARLVNNLEEKISRIKFDFDEINKMYRDKYPEVNLKMNDSLEEKYLENKIENSFKEKIKTIKTIKEFPELDDLFKMFEKGMNEFIKVDDKDKLEIDDKNNIYQKKIQGEIKDEEFKKCYEVLAPCIGYKKASVNFFEIQKYFYNKTQKKDDEMCEIYSYIYSCLFGTRDINQTRASIEAFYSSEEKNFIELLRNIIKYTFYYDKKRKGKPYYLLTLLKELVHNGDEATYNIMFELRHKSQYEFIFMTIVLFNSDCSIYRSGFEYFGKK